MNDTSILVERPVPGVAKVILNTPPMNLNTLASIRRLQEVFTALDGDEGVRCIVVAGATERAFCAGRISRSSQPSGTTSWTRSCAGNEALRSSSCARSR
jgi:enoyl-CoA hydratase/carnithine racemase